MGILDLKSMDGAYAEAEATTFEEIPEGRYQCRITEAKPGLTKSTNNPMISWKMIVLAGEYKGRTVFKNMVLTPNSLGLVKSDLQALKFAKPLSQLEGALPTFINQAVEIRRTTNGKDDQGRPRYNTFFQGLLDIGMAEGVDMTPPPESGIPF